MYTIYKHTNTITNKSYIGLTKHTVKKRFNQHKKMHLGIEMENYLASHFTMQ